MVNIFKNSQAALEFLMTYGWAILVVLIAIGALSYFGIFDITDLVIPNKCILTPGLTCSDFKIGPDSVQIVLTNNFGEDITIIAVKLEECEETLLSPSFNIKNNGMSTFVIGLCTINEKRYDTNVNITYLGESGLEHTIIGEMTGRNEFVEIGIRYEGQDGDFDGADETFRDGSWQELSIENQRALYTYDGHPSHYLYWPQYIDQEIWYVDAETGEKIEQVLTPASAGEGDFQLEKCLNDGEYSGCEVDTSEACNGLVKDYGDIETGVDVNDDNYRDCEPGNPRVGRFTEPYNNGNYLRFRFYRQSIGGYGKYKVCLKYRHNSGLETAPKCIESISEYIDSDSGGNINSQYNYGDLLSFPTPINIRTRYDQQPVSNLKKRCSVHPWSYWHDPRNDNGPSVVLRRYRSWDNYWGYIGINYGISSSQSAGDREITTELQFPSSCYLRDRDGGSNYAFYHHNCGWYHNVDGLDKTVYCCGSWQDSDSGNCDEFVVSGQYGGTLTITGYVNPAGDNYDDMRVYIECPGGTAFGNVADPYTFRAISGANYFWINDMDYSAEKTFSEPLPDQRYVANAGDFSCTDIKLNLCGRTQLYTEFFDSNGVYGVRYTSPSTICVSGAECPHANC